MDNFNLIDSPWIPVRWKADSPETPPLVSLNGAFSRGEEIADLDCAPHERIALVRLLVCITHAALGAPETADDWDDFGEDRHTAIPEYLHREDIYPHFNLLGDGPRFLQKPPKDSNAKKHPLCKVFFQLASGNSPKLQDHWGEDSRPWKASDAAMGLLVFQNFFVGGSMSKFVLGNGPSLKSMQTLLCGDSLSATILKNCMDQETLEGTGAGLGRPIWESAPDHNLLARFAPVPCALWLTDDITGTPIGQGYQYPEFESYRDPYATAIVSSDKRRLLRANLEKGIWHDLHLLTAQKDLDGTSGPLNLQTYKEHSDLDTHIDLWVGELFKAKDAKIVDLVESTFTIPSTLFSSDGRNIYTSGIEHADAISKKLYGAIKSYWATLKHENPPVEAGQKHFWHHLDQHHRELIQLASKPEERTGLPAIGAEGAEDIWTETVRKAAKSAFDAVCPRSTPRQIQAYANGIKSLLKALYPKSKTPKKTT